MNTMLPQRYKQLGLSLIELMLAMVIGLSIIASAVTVFSGSRKSSDLNAALTEMQDNARFAMDTIGRELRMAGFQGCVDINTSTAKVIANNAPTDNYFATSASASLIQADGTWLPAAPLGFNIPDTVGAPVPGTHALSVQFGSPSTFTFQPMATPNADVVLNSTDSGLVNGDLVLISNCQVADIFSVTNADGATLQHSSSGNRDNNLSAPYGLTASGNDLARIMRFEANIYYIGDTTRMNGAGQAIYSLYKQSLPYTNPPIEMVEGVANMQLQLGFRGDATPDDQGITYVRPENAAGVSGRMQVVRFGLLMQSYDPILEQEDTSTYFIAGQRLAPTEGTVNPSNSYPKDNRLKLAFNSTVKIRNRR
jgi:type IV pilus assembly protein PilW